jgi:protein phosphatase
MGTTASALLIVGAPGKQRGFIAHVGDSRIYLVRNGELKQLTVDHSLVMEQVRRGIITAEQALTSSLQNIILRALGSEDEVEVDVSEFEGAEADILLLASDGLTKMISDDDILRIVTAADEVDAACDQLIAAAKKNGGEDNVTCLLVGLTREKLLDKFFGKKKQPLFQDSL